MPRPKRIQSAGFLHHVTARGNDKQEIFLNPQDYQRYLKTFQSASREYGLKTYNFCLMKNHVHFLVEPTKDRALTLVMACVQNAYAKYFNEKYKRVGHVWQGRYKSFLVQSEKYFMACSRYIDLNPVKAGIKSDPKDYTWSGYQALAWGKKKSVLLGDGFYFDIEEHPVYLELGKDAAARQNAYRVLVASSHWEELDLINRRTYILGDKEFKKAFK